MSDLFECVPLTSDPKHLDLIQGFTIDREKDFSIGSKLLPEVLPGIEISHFAVNDNYRRRAGKNGKPIRGLGAYFYPAFIYPIIEDVTERIGVNMVYLYAAGGESLISYYKRIFDFQALGEDDFYIPLEPGYDYGCTFMYRLLG